MLHTAELANHFGPIWKVLEHSGFDILMDGGVQLPKAPERATIRKVSEVLEAKDRYAVLVSNHIVRMPTELERMLYEKKGRPYEKAIIKVVSDQFELVSAGAGSLTLMPCKDRATWRERRRGFA